MNQKDSLVILLVEDNDGDYILTREMLKEAQDSAFQFGELKLIRADSFKTAVDQITNKKIDCILLDLSLPDAQGVETFYCLRALTSNIPIVIFSGLKDEALAYEAVHAGAQDYLIKGNIDSSLLIRSIRYAIQRTQGIEQINTLRQDALRSDKAKTEFIFHFANDVQEIINSAYHLANDASSNPAVNIKDKLINRVSGLIKSLKTTLDFVKDFSYLELDFFFLENSEHELKDLIVKIIDEAAVFDDEIASNIEHDFSEIYEEKVMIDSERLKQIVQCFYKKLVLFSNRQDTVFIKATSKFISDTKIEIHFEFKIKGKELSNSEKQLLFESISQSDFSSFRKYGPSGLELAVASRITKLMDGKVWVTSTKQEGTVLNLSVTGGRL